MDCWHCLSAELSKSLMAVSNVALCVQFNLAADDTPRNRLTFPGGEGSVAPLQGRNRCMLSYVSTVTISTSCTHCATDDSRQTFINKFELRSSDMLSRAGVIWWNYKSCCTREPLKEGGAFTLPLQPLNNPLCIINLDSNRWKQHWIVQPFSPNFEKQKAAPKDKAEVL